MTDTLQRRTRLGRDLRVGDILPRWGESFMILALIPGERSRTGVNCWGESVVLHDDHEYRVWSS